MDRMAPDANRDPMIKLPSRQIRREQTQQVAIDRYRAARSASSGEPASHRQPRPGEGS
jgi:hypothetical protein